MQAERGETLMKGEDPDMFFFIFALRASVVGGEVLFYFFFIFSPFLSIQHVIEILCKFFLC